MRGGRGGCGRVWAGGEQGFRAAGAECGERPPGWGERAGLGGAVDALLMALFRAKLGDEVGRDGAAGRSGYDGLMDLVWELQGGRSSARDVSAATRRVLNSLFPPGLPAAFKVLFAGPMPELSCRMNAFVTALTCKWLMGPCEVNDVELPGGRVLPGRGVKVERCKFLEEAGCAAVCMNTCKIPTETFFREDMGLDLTMEPNYDDFSCQFSFGKQPEAATTADLHSTRCFQSCSQKAALFDDSRGPGADPCVQCPNVDLNALEPPAELAPPA